MHASGRLTEIPLPHTLLLYPMTSAIYSTISDLSRMLTGRELSACELIEAHLDRTQKLQAKLNAFTHVDVAGALVQARSADAAIREQRADGPLHGIPITIKSCIDVKNWATSAGTLLRKNNIATKNAELVARLKAAGAIILGSTNTPEFLMHYETDNLLQGKTSNPWNLSCSAGGSSGGEAAAISSGCSVAGIGSDGGGSIRVPAHFCGICGLKPTPGRISGVGHYPPVHEDFPWLGVVGPVARTVADLRTVFQAVAEPVSTNARSVLLPEKDASLNNVQGVRVGILEAEPILGHPTSETNAAVHQAAKYLEQLGFSVEPFHSTNLDALLEEALALWWFFFGRYVAQLFHNHYRGQESQFSPMFCDYLYAAESSGPITREEIAQSIAAREILYKKILQAIQPAQILLSPVCLSPAFRHAEGHWRAMGYRETMRHSQWLNLAGLPGLSLPIAISAAGLPIGIQLIASPNQEELLLAVAAQLENARGPWQLPPPQL